jgi:E3 ubiquitin-protein ligase HUWE1
VESFSEEQKASFLKFVIGSSRVSAGGFSRLLGCDRNNPFTITKRPMGANTNNLPTAYTCFNVIELPSYESYERLREKPVKIAKYSGRYGFI